MAGNFITGPVQVIDDIGNAQGQGQPVEIRADCTGHGADLDKRVAGHMQEPGLLARHLHAHHDQVCIRGIGVLPCVTGLALKHPHDGFENNFVTRGNPAQGVGKSGG